MTPGAKLPQELARPAQKAVALAQQEKSTWTGADLIKYLGTMRAAEPAGLDPGQALAAAIGERDLTGSVIH